MRRTSVATLVTLLVASTCGAGEGKHPDLTVPSVTAKTPEADAPTELEPIEVTGKTNPMDLGINRAKLLVDLRCKLCKDADFSVKGVPPDRFYAMFLEPANDLTRNAQAVLNSRCGDQPSAYLSCFAPGMMQVGNFKEGAVVNGQLREFVRLLKGQ